MFVLFTSGLLSVFPHSNYGYSKCQNCLAIIFPTVVRLAIQIAEFWLLSYLKSQQRLCLKNKSK